MSLKTAAVIGSLLSALLLLLALPAAGYENSRRFSTSGMRPTRPATATRMMAASTGVGAGPIADRRDGARQISVTRLAVSLSGPALQVPDRLPHEVVVDPARRQIGHGGVGAGRGESVEGLGGLGGPDVVGLVGEAHVGRAAVGRAVDGHGAQAALVTGAQDANRNFTAIGHEHRLNRTR